MEKGHIEFDSYEDVELAILKESAYKLYNALQVILKTESLRSHLEVHDYQAYAQAKGAIKSYEDNLFHL